MTQYKAAIFKVAHSSKLLTLKSSIHVSSKNLKVSTITSYKIKNELHNFLLHKGRTEQTLLKPKSNNVAQYPTSGIHSLSSRNERVWEAPFLQLCHSLAPSGQQP